LVIDTTGREKENVTMQCDPRILLIPVLLAGIASGMACHARRANPEPAEASASSAAVACGPSPKGLGSLTQAGALTVFGEVHGTVEIPSFVANAACLTAKMGHEVAIGLEVPSHLQPDVNRYLDSEGGPDDVKALLKDEHWNAQFGNASKALLSLIEESRALRHSGRKVSVFFFDKDKDDSGDRDQIMAAHIAAQAASAPTAVTLVLTGNLHARADSERWMAWHLARRHPGIHTLNVAYSGGSAYLCVDDTQCGIRADLPGQDRGSEPFVELFTAADAKGYDGIFYIGGSVTPSPPLKHEGPMIALPVPLRAQADKAYRAKDYKACTKLFIDSATASSGPAAAQDLYGATCCASLNGEVDAALDHLKAAIDHGFVDVAQMGKDPDLAAVRNDPRWRHLLSDAEAHATAARPEAVRGRP
jgi:hypothetical protein